MIEVEVPTRDRTDFIEVGDRIEAALAAEGCRNGRVLLFLPHTTAGLTVQENADPDVLRDLGRSLDRMVPWEHEDYRHFEGNSAAHVKSSLLGCSILLPVRDGRLALGRWQGVFLCEFDGPRRRRLQLDFEGNRSR